MVRHGLTVCRTRSRSVSRLEQQRAEIGQRAQVGAVPLEHRQIGALGFFVEPALVEVEGAVKVFVGAQDLAATRIVRGFAAFANVTARVRF